MCRTFAELETSYFQLGREHLSSQSEAILNDVIKVGAIALPRHARGQDVSSWKLEAEVWTADASLSPKSVRQGTCGLQWEMWGPAPRAQAMKIMHSAPCIIRSRQTQLI